MRNRPTKNGAFTLVELLVVMGIIALLAAMLMPVIQNSIEAARRGAAQNEIQNIETAMQEFQMDFGFYPPHTIVNGAGSPLFLVMDHTGATINIFDAINNASGLGLPDDTAVTPAQCLVFFLGTKFRANPSPAAPGERVQYRLIRVDPNTGSQRPARTNGGPYYDFPDAIHDNKGRVRQFHFVDQFKLEGRCADPTDLTAGNPRLGDPVCYYQFQNNADFSVIDPLNVNTEGVDIWSPGPDGRDLISMFMEGSFRGGDNGAFDDLVSALNTDGDPDEVLTKGDLPYGGDADYVAADLDGSGDIQDNETFAVDEITNW